MSQFRRLIIWLRCRLPFFKPEYCYKQSPVRCYREEVIKITDWHPNFRKRPRGVHVSRSKKLRYCVECDQRVKP